MQGRGEIAANLLGQPLLSAENVVNSGLIDIGKARRATAGEFHQKQSHSDLRPGPPYAGLQQIARFGSFPLFQPSSSRLSNHPQSMILSELVDHLFGQPITVDLNEATREVIALSSPELRRNNVAVRAELAEDLSPVTGDRVQLQQVILNLLWNATDAMSTVDDRPRELVIRTNWDGRRDHVRLSVKDVGVGFEPQSADRLFEGFYTTKDDGMGIGLSVSKSIIESHQGRLWAETNDGPEATFSFSIPCRREEYLRPTA